MIVSSAPFRISFLGGGSDLRSFYERSPGAVVSCTISKYSFAIVHKYFHGSKYNIKYSRTDYADDLNGIQNPLIREALRMYDIAPGIEVVSIADIPSGTGLGSSSSFAVALINALRAYRGQFSTKEMLAEAACRLEIDRLGEPIGKQDQYAAAYGGLNFIEFRANGSVNVQPILLPSERVSRLEQRLTLFYTGQQRQTRDILADQTREVASSEAKFASLREMVQYAYDAHSALLEDRLDDFGDLLHQGWMRKRSLSERISNSQIDDYYERARRAGAIGGKIAGAGSGGFLLIYTPPERQKAVAAALSELEQVELNFDWNGARIVFAQ